MLAGGHARRSTSTEVQECRAGGTRFPAVVSVPRWSLRLYQSGVSGFRSQFTSPCLICLHFLVDYGTTNSAEAWSLLWLLHESESLTSMTQGGGVGADCRLSWAKSWARSSGDLALHRECFLCHFSLDVGRAAESSRGVRSFASVPEKIFLESSLADRTGLAIVE